jgi:predicted RNase H-like HicB family nuclease
VEGHGRHAGIIARRVDPFEQTFDTLVLAVPCGRRQELSRTLHLTAAVGRDGDLFWARCLEVKELVAHGASPQEAVDALAELAAGQLADLARPYLPHALIVPLDVSLPG